jgi:hypothetical protein
VLVNGNLLIRQLQPLIGRVVLMHGHRHIDWIGECMGLLVVSAPSPVMEATDDMTTSFYIHTLERTPEGNVALGQPEEIRIDGVAPLHDSAASG